MQKAYGFLKRGEACYLAAVGETGQESARLAPAPIVEGKVFIHTGKVKNASQQ